MFGFFKKLYNGIQLAFKDIKNRKAFASDINDAKADPRSLFSRYGLIVNEDYTKISLLFNVPENFILNGNERLLNMKIQEIIEPVTKYLSYTLGWAEYIIVPQIFHIEDNDTSTGESLTYLSVWEWAPIKSKYYLLKVGLISLGIIAAITTGLILFL